MYVRNMRVVTLVAGTACSATREEQRGRACGTSEIWNCKRSLRNRVGDLWILNKGLLQSILSFPDWAPFNSDRRTAVTSRRWTESWV